MVNIGPARRLVALQQLNGSVASLVRRVSPSSCKWLVHTIVTSCGPVDQSSNTDRVIGPSRATWAPAS